MIRSPRRQQQLTLEPVGERPVRLPSFSGRAPCVVPSTSRLMTDRTDWKPFTGDRNPCRGGPYDLREANGQRSRRETQPIKGMSRGTATVG